MTSKRTRAGRAQPEVAVDPAPAPMAPVAADPLHPGPALAREEAAGPVAAAAGPPAEWRWPMVHREGWPFVGAAATVALLSFLFGWTALGWLGLLAAAATAAFFRDPERSVPPGEDVLVAPADGLVCQIAEVEVPRQLVGPDGLAEGRLIRISIFLSVFDVHVNRTPVAGTVRRLVYVPGLFLNASLDKASDDNERSYMVIEALDGTRIGVVQIAGLVARRIVSFVHPGAMLATGQRYGLIRFGSRTDLYVPKGWVVTARKGQRTIGGETVLACRHG